MKKTPIVSVLWISSLATVYILASSNSSPDKADAHKDVVVVSPGTAPAVPAPEHDGGSLAKKPLNTAPAVERIVEYVTVTEDRILDSRSIGTALSDALNSSDVINKNLQVAEIIAGLTPENVEAALNVFENTERDFRNDQYFRLFMYAWGQVDGKSAVEYAFFNDEGKKVEWGGTSAMTAWAETDPAAAMEFLNGVDDENRSKHYMRRGLVMGWSKSDLEGATAYVAGLENERERNGFVDTLARAYIDQKGADGAFRWAELTASQSENSSYAGAVFETVTMRVARDNPESAAAFIDRNIDSDHISERAFGEVADGLAERDPAAAADWLESHWEDERVNGDVVWQLVNEWADKDPAGAAGWLDNYLDTDKVNAGAVAVTSRRWADKDPAAAITWVGSIENIDMQSRGYAMAMDQWVRNDSAAAGEWLNSVERSKVHDQTVGEYARHIAVESPTAAIDWAQQIVDPTFREETTIRVAQTLYRNDPETTGEWLKESGLSEQAQEMVKNPPRRRGRGRGRWGR